MVVALDGRQVGGGPRGLARISGVGGGGDCMIRADKEEPQENKGAS